MNIVGRKTASKTSVVAITGAAVRSAPELLGMPVESMGPMLVGCAAALVSGVAAIWTFVRLLRSRGFHYFAWYAWGVGALVLTVLAFA